MKVESICRRSWGIKLLGGVALWMLMSTAAFAQGNVGYGICSACQSIATQIKSLEAQKKNASKNLKETKSSYYTEEVKDTQNQINAKKQQLKACMVSKCSGKPDLTATFTGKATVTTSNSNASGPFKQNVSASVTFYKWDHTHFSLTLSPIKVGPFDTPAGSNTTTVTGWGTGVVNLGTGAMTVTLDLHFHHSSNVAGDSDMTITLSTSSGSPLNDGGKVTLKGTGKFKDGYLGGDSCTMTISGTIAPHP